MSVTPSKTLTSPSQENRSSEVKETKDVITINDQSGGPLLAGHVFDVPSQVFLDTGARINLISLDFLRKVKPGLVIIEPTNYNIQGVTGNKLSPIGETFLSVMFGNYYKMEITAVVVEQQSFPGNLLIGYDTMRDEDITIIPARGGVKLSYKFLPFIDNSGQEIAASVSKTQITNDKSVPHDSDNTASVKQSLINKNKTVHPLNNVAERYLSKSSPLPAKDNNVPQVKQIPLETSVKTNSTLTKSQTPAPTDALEIVSGSVTTSTMLQAQSICKVQVKLKGVRDHKTAITLSESSRVNGIHLDNGLYNVHKGKTEVFVSNTLHTDIILKKGTALGSFQVSKTVEEINDHENSDESKQTAQVLSLQESIQSESDIKQHLAPIDRPDLESHLINLLFLHKAAVALPGDALGKTTLLKHRIKLKPGTQPIYVPAYRLPHSKIATVDKLIAEMLSQDVIEHSNSEWNFPLILVPKSDGTMRPVIDYRKLNEHTIPDRLPLPVITDILRSLGTKNTLFSTIDIKSAFWQIELDEESRPMTAFSTPSGHYQFRRMPFGLSNSPLTFMRLINQALHGLIGNTASVFLDDILIVSETEEEHFHKLNQVFSRLSGLSN